MTWPGAEEEEQEPVERSDQAQDESRQVRELSEGLDTVGYMIHLLNCLNFGSKLFVITRSLVKHHLLYSSLPYSATWWLLVVTVKWIFCILEFLCFCVVFSERWFFLPTVLCTVITTGKYRGRLFDCFCQTRFSGEADSYFCVCLGRPFLAGSCS